MTIRELDVMEAAASGVAAKRVKDELDGYDSRITVLEGNQTDIQSQLTPEGGIAIYLTNKTGSASIKGTVIEASAGTDNSFGVAPSNAVDPIGVVYDDGIADGELCRIVVAGRAQVLLKDTTGSTRGNWVEVSDVAGRANATLASPNQVTHFAEVGHSLETKTGGTNVLLFCMIHFN